MIAGLFLRFGGHLSSNNVIIEDENRFLPCSSSNRGIFEDEPLFQDKAGGMFGEVSF